MSQAENGDEDSDPSPKSEAARLAAIIEVCAVNAERSFLESQASRQAAERCEQALREVKRSIGRISIAGVSNWRYQASLVTIAASVGAVVGTIAMYFTR